MPSLSLGSYSRFYKFSLSKLVPQFSSPRLPILFSVGMETLFSPSPNLGFTILPYLPLCFPYTKIRPASFFLTYFLNHTSTHFSGSNICKNGSKPLFGAGFAVIQCHFNTIVCDPFHIKTHVFFTFLVLYILHRLQKLNTISTSNQPSCPQDQLFHQAIQQCGWIHSHTGLNRQMH